ncbi:DUF4304 domain-containing protein [Microvirga splendida]|uniref:DUF4304 domain-containing protein n=1 Tax=Microvirga splendida TaxID=2795727 RepID=A0ABS0XVW7_9HYPH|nr:DUF4304 domain-containing protein [Microvirga splendida]MBJ6124189.1 DUF4304 domain-containing protein [Microvirga splendida]
MGQTVTSKAISLASRMAFDTHLKAAGFRKQGAHLHRAKENLIHGIHFQPSRGNQSESGTFTINLIVTSSAIYSAFFGSSLPSNPATAGFPITERIGFLMPAHKDHWWYVSPETDVERLSSEVSEAITHHALPFFDEYVGPDALLHKLRAQEALPGVADPQIPVLHAVVAKHAGYDDEARQLLRQAIETSHYPGFTETVKKVANRIGLVL